MYLSEPSEFLNYLESRHSRIRTFLAKHQDILVLINAGTVLAHALSSISTITNSSNNAKLWCGILWQTVSRYQLQSIELILAGELDAGIALLRMATELARDVAVLGKDEASLVIWKKREEDSKASKLYRDSFKFDQSPLGLAARDLYKFASRFGIHGHNTLLAHAKPDLQNVSTNRIVHFDIEENAPFEAIDIWLRSFFPLHGLCAQAMRVDDPNRYEVYAAYLSFLKELTSLRLKP